MDSNHERLCNEAAELRARLRKTTEALYFAVEALEHLGYKDVEVKRGKAIVSENDAEHNAYWEKLLAKVNEHLTPPSQ